MAKDLLKEILNVVPNHYELLGLELFESDQDKIKRAALEATRKVKEWEGAIDRDVAENVLELRANINRAFAELSDETKKNACDAKLAEKLGLSKRRFDADEKNSSTGEISIFSNNVDNQHPNSAPPSADFHKPYANIIQGKKSDVADEDVVLENAEVANTSYRSEESEGGLDPASVMEKYENISRNQINSKPAASQPRPILETHSAKSVVREDPKSICRSFLNLLCWHNNNRQLQFKKILVAIGGAMLVIGIGILFFVINSGSNVKKLFENPQGKDVDARQETILIEYNSLVKKGRKEEYVKLYKKYPVIIGKKYFEIKVSGDCGPEVVKKMENSLRGGVWSIHIYGISFRTDYRPFIRVSLENKTLKMIYIPENKIIYSGQIHNPKNVGNIMDNIGLKHNLFSDFLKK